MRTMIAAVLLAASAVGAAPAQVVVTRGGPGGGGRMNIGGTPPVFEEPPAGYGVRGWRVGQWARYSITTTMGQMPMNQFRQVSIVGQQGERFWVETQDEFTGPMTSRGPVQKMLIPFGVVRERVGTELYTMTPDSAVFRRTLLRQGSDAGREDIGFPDSWTRVGEEQVQVAAGAFRAVHYRKGEEHLWVSGDAGPLGVVKYETPTLILELAGRGDNARSRIPFGG